MLEKSKPAQNDDENELIQMNNAYRRTFFQGRENYESNMMYFSQNFAYGFNKTIGSKLFNFAYCSKRPSFLTRLKNASTLIDKLLSPLANA